MSNLIVKLIWAALLAPLVLAAGDASRPPIAGTWDIAAADSNGVRTRWLLAVKEDAGRFSAQLRADDGTLLDAVDPRLEGNHFRFKLRINATELVEVDLQSAADGLDGVFRGNDSGTGSLKARRIPTADISGVWTGRWRLDPDGQPGPHHMTLQLAGDRVSGSAGPSPEQQARIVDGTFRDGRLTFDIAIQNGPRFRFDFMVAGEMMWGDATLIMGETRKSFRLSARRASR